MEPYNRGHYTYQTNKASEPSLIKENDEIYVHLPKNKIWGMND